MSVHTGDVGKPVGEESQYCFCLTFHGYGLHKSFLNDKLWYTNLRQLSVPLKPVQVKVTMEIFLRLKGWMNKDINLIWNQPKKHSDTPYWATLLIPASFYELLNFKANTRNSCRKLVIIQNRHLLLGHSFINSYTFRHLLQADYIISFKTLTMLAEYKNAKGLLWYSLSRWRCQWSNPFCC